MRKDWLRIRTADDDGAPTTEYAINTARNLVGVPLDDGGIQIELHAGGSDIEIVISPIGGVVAVSWSKP